MASGRTGFPVFQHVHGPPEAPTQVWASRTLGAGIERPIDQLGAWIDEVAWGSESIRADPRPEVSALADPIARAHRGLHVGTAPRLLDEDAILAVNALSLAVGVETWLEPFPPGAVAGVVPARHERLRLSLSAPKGFEMERPWDAFPFAFVCAPWEDGFAPRPMSEYARIQRATPRARGATIVLAADAGGLASDHLLVSVNLERERRGARENYGATLSMRAADVVRAALAWADAAVVAGAHGGLLHPLGAYVWDNQRRADTWDLAGRSHAALAKIGTDDGHTVLDLSRAPTRLDLLEGAPFAPGAVTWLGAEWARACGDRLARFSDCLENRDLGGGCRRIVLEDPARGVTPELVRRQHALRREVDASRTAPAEAAPIAGTPPAGTEASRRSELARLAAEAARAKTDPTRR